LSLVCLFLSLVCLFLSLVCLFLSLVYLFCVMLRETGEIDNGGIVATTDNAIRGEVDAGYSGTVKDAHGSLVVEIDTTGLVKGNANTTIAQLENFSFSVENLRYLAAFFLLLDGAPMLRKRAEFGPL